MTIISSTNINKIIDNPWGRQDPNERVGWAKERAFIKEADTDAHSSGNSLSNLIASRFTDKLCHTLVDSQPCDCRKHLIIDRSIGEQHEMV